MTLLNENELETLRILWERGPLKPPEIEAEFASPIDNGTLRSVLRVLMEKKLVVRRKRGRAFHYRAKVTRQGSLSRMARLMARTFSGGSTSELIAQLIETEKLSPQEIEKIKRIAGEGNARKSKPNPRKRKNS